MPTVNDEKPFRIQDYLTHSELADMYPVDLDTILQNVTVTDNLNEIIKVCLDKQYLTVGQFIQGKDTEYLLDICKKLENPDTTSVDFNESTLFAGLLAFAEGETCLSWMDIAKYRGLLYFYLKVTLMSRAIKLKINENSFTMSPYETVRKIFGHVSVGELFNFYVQNGNEGLFMILHAATKNSANK